jgi:hypothetical protein
MSAFEQVTARASSFSVWMTAGRWYGFFIGTSAGAGFASAGHP